MRWISPRWLTIGLAWFLLAASSCGETASDGDADGDADADGDGDGDSDGDGDGDSEPAPEAPDEDDPDYLVVENARWLMAGDGLTSADEAMEVTVEPPPGVEAVDAWLDGHGPVRFEVDAEGMVIVTFDTASASPGEHEVILAAAEADEAFAVRRFILTHALYVVLACDWDDPDNSAAYMENVDALRDGRAGLRFTHYFGPYTFTDPEVSEARRGELAAWLLERRDTYGDEIALHIHPYCSFVEHAGLTCRHSPSFVYDEGDTSGYTVVFSSYTVEEQIMLLESAADLFEDWGLGRPTAFRAGGWTGDETTAEALVAAGYEVQADSILATHIEEWDGALLYDWLMDQWGSVTTTSQPYYPDPDDIALEVDPDQALPLLQVPGNGAMIDYMVASELRGAFEDNLGDGVMTEPTVFHTGLHPTNFSAVYLRTLDGAFSYSVDESLYEEDQGPVVFATVSELLAVYPR